MMSPKTYYASAVAIGLFIGLILWLRLDKDKYGETRKHKQEQTAAYNAFIKLAGLSLADQEALVHKTVKKAYDCKACYKGETLRLYLLDEDTTETHFQLWIKEQGAFHLYSKGSCGYPKSDSTYLILQGPLMPKQAQYRINNLGCHGDFVDPLGLKKEAFFLNEKTKFYELKDTLHELWVLRKTQGGWMNIQNQKQFYFNKKHSIADALKSHFEADHTLPITRAGYSYRRKQPGLLKPLLSE